MDLVANTQAHLASKNAATLAIIVHVLERVRKYCRVVTSVHPTVEKFVRTFEAVRFVKIQILPQLKSLFLRFQF